MQTIREKISALAERKARQNRGRLPVIDRGSPEWDAWRAYRSKYGAPNGFFDSREKWTVPTEMPPQDIDLELQAIGDGKLKSRLRA